MTYESDEYNFLCVLFAASRDALRRHRGYEDLAAHYNDLGEAVFRKEKLTAEMLEQIKKALIHSFWIDGTFRDDKTTQEIRDLRQRALLRTVAMLKEAEGEK